MSTHNQISTGSPFRWTVVGAIACFAVAAGLLILSLSHAGAVTASPLAIASSSVPNLMPN